ncbi:hypothetical protein DFH06DRAFT_737426 [Mycena polygramma]|nr:hypothetical protein DFH06DRAFT_737426 [Mycena polygramma]
MTLMHHSAIVNYLVDLFTRDVLEGLLAGCTSRALLGERVDAELEEQYREVDLRFLHFEDGTAQRLWNRAVADRVRVLSIGPYFVCDALDNSQARRFKDTIRIARALVTRFRNLEKCHILWHERPTATLRRAPRKHLPDTLRLASGFLAAPFSSARHLRTLKIECSLDKAEHLFLRTAVLPRLEEFTLCIRDDHAGNLDAAGYIMVHHIARLLNNTHRTLRSFSFETSLSTDFAPLFSALGFFPHLATLALTVPTAAPHLGDPSAVKRFLQLHHATVERFTLRGFCTNKLRADTVGLWLSECLRGVTFSALHTLSVGTSFIPVEVVMLCVEQWADTLRDVDVSGEYLSFDAVEDVLMRGDMRLERLDVGVACLCPEIMDLLAEHLPGLSKLTLNIRYVAPHRDEPPCYDKTRHRKQTDAQLVSVLSTTPF